MTEEIASEVLLTDEDTFLTCGVHIGTKQKSGDMEEYIYKVREDGLRIINIKKTSEQISEAANFLKDFKPEEVMVVSARQYGQKPAKMFSDSVNFSCIPGRFTPGRLTNPRMESFVEPVAIILTDPAADAQPFREAVSIDIPVIAFCDSNNLTTNVDLVIPGNNKGRRSLALMYRLLAIEILRARGQMGADEELEETIDDFEAPLI